jgi:hypothetical protein
MCARREMIRNYIRWMLGALAIFSFALTAQAKQATGPAPHDRWVEIDLYWFDGTDPEGSAKRFWERYAPLYKNVAGYRGVILNPAMTVNYIMDYKGSLAQPIFFPKGSGQEIGMPISGQLPGTTAERQAAWRTRYSAADNHQAQSGYGKWTYGDFKRLADALRAEGRARGIADFKVGSLIVGGDGTYGEKTPFSIDHPEAWTRWRVDAEGAIESSSNFDPLARLRRDPTPRAGLPQGISEGMPVHTAFAAQWGALSRDVGLDALMLRDSMSFPRGFTRYGPFGDHVPDAATADRMTSGVATFIRDTKKANPKALLMMWSTAASPVSDWRSNGIDVERIANEGFLDIFVDQTWSGAWNEIGVRQQTYWNAPILGWTYQQGSMLQHAAVLANSKVRHYFLTDTFDAWESWDTIHTTPDRLRWAIWAYAHIAVKTPDGLKVPAGSYISWGNRGKDLLGPEDVSFLAANLNEAARDAASMTEVYGPTMVYSRDVAAAQVQGIAALGDPRDRIDEQVGSLIKWPVPILSITRMEWVPQVKAPLFVFGATKPLPAKDLAMIEKLAAGGQPMAFFGGFDHGTDAALLRLAGASATKHAPRVEDLRLTATLGQASGALSLRNFPSTFTSPPPARNNRASPADSIYAFGSFAGLVRHRSGGVDIVAWDPVPLSDVWYRPLIDNMNGSPVPYALASATLTAQLAESDTVRAGEIDLQQTGTFAAWRGRDGRVRLLSGNLEEGLRDDADRARTIRIALPKSWGSPAWTSAWGGTSPASPGEVTIPMGPQGSVLLISQKPVSGSR